MIYVTRDDSIDLLSLSTRTYNRLRGIGLDKIGQVLDYPPDQWSNIRKLGNKSCQEITSIVAQLQSREGQFILVEQLPQEAASISTATLKKGTVSIPSQQMAKLEHISVKKMNLSVRATNCLENAGIYTAADLVQTSEKELRSIKNLGVKTLQEVLAKQQEYFDELGHFLHPAPQESGNNERELQMAWLVQTLSPLLKLSKNELLQEIIVFQKGHPEQLDNAALLSLLCQQSTIRLGLRRTLLGHLEKHQFGMTREALVSHFPKELAPEFLDGLLEELERRNQITRNGDRILRRYPTALEYAQNLSNDTRREILIARLHGETLEEIGKRMGKTRERIRQITVKALHLAPTLQEDQYQELFNRYEFTKREFCLAFHEPMETYHYLDLKRPKDQRRPLREILYDESIPEFYRRKAERVIFQNYVTLDGVRVEKTSPALANYVLRAMCRESTSIEEFMERYMNLLDSIGEAHNPSLHIEKAYYQNRLSTSELFLWSRGYRFRYYPIPERDYEHLFETLQLDDYEDMDFSSRKLYRDYPELMEEYDIRDEYELHNLLKKIWPAEDTRVQFKKMPTILIGTPDRDQQVIDLLRQYAPISNTELAERYEERYGVKASTALANYFDCIAPFFHNGIYRMDQPPLPPEQEEHLSGILTDDFYTLSELRRIYLREYHDGDLSLINPYSLHRLGFQIYTSYVISTRFGGAADYFTSLLSKDLSDMRPYVRKFNGITLYTSIVGRMKQRREIVEFAPYQFIHIRRLNAYDVTVTNLENYCASVRAFVPAGSYFTLESLRQDGFTHSLDQLGFDDWFYTSILIEDRENFSYRRLGKTKLLYHGTADVVLLDLLRWLVEPEGRMDLYDLTDLLERRYGIVIPKHKILETVRHSDLYYDAIMEAVYIDYDTYFEEV